ncbi:MAG: hypothetical protein ACXQS4_02495 [Methermicoccaceae archaeon]
MAQSYTSFTYTLDTDRITLYLAGERVATLLLNDDKECREIIVHHGIPVVHGDMGDVLRDGLERFNDGLRSMMDRIRGD